LQRVDVMVLGAGIVGVSTAVHLRRRGHNVILLDRRHPGEETSYGNAGIIERNGFVPISIPTNPSVLFDIAFGQSAMVNYDFGTLLRILPWLRQLSRHSAPQARLHYARAIAPLKALAVSEHRQLAREANTERFYRQSGWLHLYRSDRTFEAAEEERHFARIYGVQYQSLDSADINVIEPGLYADPFRGVFWPETDSVSSPGGVTEAFWRHFIGMGGKFIQADVSGLEATRGGWEVPTDRGAVWAKQAVVSLGPWSTDLLKRSGHRFPMVVKRGYHLHFRPPSGASISRPIVDMDHGYALTPMERGLRLTTGVEFAARDKRPTPVQLDRAQRRARDFFPLGEPVDTVPWMGCRPCLPDSLPIVGPSPREKGLWLNFGHGHAGFTLGPVTGRLMAEMLSGEEPCVDPEPVSPVRFSL